MNSHNPTDHDHFDVLIGHYLKNWLERQNPPKDAREKLLFAASMDLLERAHPTQFWLPFLRHLALRLTSAFAINYQESQYPLLSQNSLSAHTNIHAWGAYQTMIRSLPTGRGILCFLY